MVTLNFSNGMSQTYPDYNTLWNAVCAMGGDCRFVGNDTYVFVPKN